MVASLVNRKLRRYPSSLQRPISSTSSSSRFHPPRCPLLCSPSLARSRGKRSSPSTVRRRPFDRASSRGPDQAALMDGRRPSFGQSARQMPSHSLRLRPLSTRQATCHQTLCRLSSSVSIRSFLFIHTYPHAHADVHPPPRRLQHPVSPPEPDTSSRHHLLSHRSRPSIALPHLFHPDPSLHLATKDPRPSHSRSPRPRLSIPYPPL